MRTFLLAIDHHAGHTPSGLSYGGLALTFKAA